ncbi:MAG: flagellar hook basal-body protein [Planctomycetes bacterium]|nr:flagellar hook basal-body protein [Planctomycetota bacterium]
MDKGLYMGVAAMRSAEKRMEAITGNLANASATAFKRQGTVTRAFEVGTGDKKHVEIESKHATDWSQGLIERRDDPWSLALDGDGFFSVETPTGEAYTRNGTFHIDDKGELFTSEGFPVAWVGQRGRVQATGEAITVDGTGKVRQGSNEIGQLKLADFADRDQLTVDRQGYWHARPDLAPKEPTAVVHQKALERSNAQSIDELVGLIKVQRSFESAANVMKSIDQSYRRLNQAR